MSQNKVKITWKAIVAVTLVMATLFAMSTAVSAGFIEFIFGEEYAVMATSSGHTHTSTCWQSVETKVACELVTPSIPYCTGGYNSCWGGNYGHGTTETWQQLVCGNP